VTEIIKLVPKNYDTQGVANSLREYADLVESGRIDNIVMALEKDGEYEFFRFASLANAITLSSLLSNRMLKAMEMKDD